MTTYHEMQQFICGSLAAASAVLFTNPFDTIKVRRQLNFSRKFIIGSKVGFLSIWREEGPLALQRGLSAAISYQVVMNGCRFAIYDRLQQELVICPIGGDVVAGGMAGAIGAFFGSPFNMLKTRLQAGPMGAFSSLKGGKTSLVQLFIEVGRKGGIRGYFRGADAMMMRTSCGSAVQLASYDGLKLWLHEAAGDSYSPYSSQFGAAMLSGVLVCLVMTPFDVIATRLYNQTQHNRSLVQGKSPTFYRNPLDCAIKTLRNEGIFAFYKGVVPHYARIGPHTVLTFFFLERFRSLIA